MQVDAVDTTLATAMAGLRADTGPGTGPGPEEASGDASGPVGGGADMPGGGEQPRLGRRRQRSARRASVEMRAHWLAAIKMDADTETANFYLLHDGHVEPASWVGLDWTGLKNIPDKLRAGGFNVQLEAERAVVAALARHELLGLAGAATPRATRIAEAAFQRTVERLAEEAFEQGFSAAHAAGEPNPSRAAGVVVPWLLQHAGSVRRAGTLAVSRVLLLLRQDTLDDGWDGVGPGFVYEVLDVPGGVALFESVEQASLPMPLPPLDDGLSSEEVLWRCDLPTGSQIVGWPVGPRVWVHLRVPFCRRGAAPPSPHDHEDWSHGPYRGRPGAMTFDQPYAFLPLWYEGRQQLAVVRRSSAVLFVDYDAEAPWSEEPRLEDYVSLFGDGPDGAYSFVSRGVGREGGGGAHGADNGRGEDEVSEGGGDDDLVGGVDDGDDLGCAGGATYDD
jgi:hypothetical protein